MPSLSRRFRAALCYVLLAALALPPSVSASNQHWRRSLESLRSAGAFHGSLRRLEPSGEDRVPQDAPGASLPEATPAKAAVGTTEERPAVLTVVGALLAVGFLVGIAMVLRRSHGQSRGRGEDARGIRLANSAADEDEEAGLGLMSGEEMPEDEYAEEDDEWEDKEAAVEDKRA